MTQALKPEQRPGERQIVAEFRKDSGGRLTLWQLTALQEKTGAGETYISRSIYDVEWSLSYGYLFDMSGFGGRGPIPVEGIYFASAGAEIEERPCRLFDPNRKYTRALRKRNRTRRLRRLPRAFDLEPGWDLLDWLQHRAIEDSAVWCSVCRDHLPGGSLCEHCWWCRAASWYSTPTERCKCKSQEECRA